MAEWPKGANEGPKKPVYSCSGCGAISSSPINHNHDSSGKRK